MSADAPPYPNRENASRAAARRRSPARVQLQFGGEFDKFTGLQPDDLLAGSVRHRATACVSRRPHARSLRSTTSASNFSVSQYRVREQRLPSTQPSRARRSATPLTSSRNSRAEFGEGLDLLLLQRAVVLSEPRDILPAALAEPSRPKRSATAMPTPVPAPTTAIVFSVMCPSECGRVNALRLGGRTSVNPVPP